MNLIEINDISNVEGKLTVLVAYIAVSFFADLRHIAYLNKASEAQNHSTSSFSKTSFVTFDDYGTYQNLSKST